MKDQGIAAPVPAVDEACRGVSVVVPTLNEGANIAPLLVGLLEAGRASGLELEVVVVDDGSTDDTRDQVRAFESKGNVKLIVRQEKGLAGAVLRGAAEARHDVIVVMDADLSHPTHKVPELAQPVLRGDCDMTIGSRYVPGGATTDWPWKRRIISRTASLLAWPFVAARDPLSGFFALRKERLLSLATETGGFKIGLEILARSEESLRVQEVPITFQERIHGSSKLGLGVMVSYLKQLKRLSGGAASLSSAWRFGLVGLLGMLADYLTFQALHSAGCSLALSHTTSFVAAAALNYTLNARWSFRGPMGSSPAKGHLVSSFASFFAVGCLALAVRGGVLALFARTAGWPPAASIIPAVAAAAIVNYLGSAFFVFSQPFQKGRAASRWGLAAVGIVAYSVVLRLAYLGQIDLLPEEAYYWNYSQHLALSYLDHPPMVAWCIRLGTAVFGQNEFGVRACAILCWLVALGFTYCLAKNLYGKPVAVRAALLFACLPFFFGVGFFMMPDAPLVACWAGAAYFLERALLGGRRAAWLGAGACIGLGMLSKYTAALIGLSAAVYLLADPRSRRWLLSPAPWAGVLLAALCFSPVILWNAANDWISFYFQGPRRWSHAEFHTPVLLLFMIILVTPLGIAAFVQGVGALRRARKSEPAVPDSDSARKLRFLLIFTLIPLGVFLAASLRCETKLNWTGPLWVVALPAMALSLGAISRRKDGLDASAVLDACWKPTILCLLLLYGFTLHVTALGMPGVSPAVFPGMVPVLATNWEDVAGEVRTLEQQLEAETGQTPLVVGLDKYELASLLAFYRRNDQGAWRTAGKSLFGKRSLMYDYWYPREVQKGRPLLLVGTEVKDVRSPSIVATVERMGPIREHLVRREGVIVGKYYTRFAYGYTAQPVVDNSYQ